MKRFFAKLWDKRKEYLPLSWKGWCVFAVSMAVSCAVTLLMQRMISSDVYVPLVFVLCTLIISLLTEGYFYGILAAVFSVFAVNWAFTYPYFKLDFSIYGYPITFMTMLAVGFAVSTLTARLKAQERIKTEIEKEKMRANLLRAISHDLRTPLTAISGSISTVLEEGDCLTGEQKKELLTDARQDADWLCRMVENLLSVTRIDGGQAIKTSDELLEEVLSETVTLFRKRRSDVEVSVTVPDELIMVSVDAMLIEQVLMNLMDNSVIHGRHTTAIVIRAETDGKNTIVSVEDDGCGIEKEILPRLFDGSLKLSGQKGDSSRSMGIGLSVCKTIIEAHGGRLWAENIPDGGARFSFSLPVSKEEI